MSEQRLKNKLSYLLDKNIQDIDFTSIIQGLQVLDLNIGIYSIGGGKIMTSTKTINIRANQTFNDLTGSDKIQILQLFNCY